MKEKFFRPEIMDKSLTRTRKTPFEVGGRRSTSGRADVRRVSFAASENLQLASHPAKPAFHRIKYVFELCHPGKPPFHRMKRRFCSRKVNCPKKNVSSTQGSPPGPLIRGCSLDELVVDYELFERGVQGVGYVEQPFGDKLSLAIFESPVALSVHS